MEFCGGRFLILYSAVIGVPILHIWIGSYNPERYHINGSSGSFPWPVTDKSYSPHMECFYACECLLCVSLKHFRH
jgi:hypothetical protein